MDLLTIHADTLRGTQRVVDGVRPDQMAKATPCSEWDVGALIAHIVGVNAMFAASLRGEAPVSMDAGERLVGDDPAGACRRTTDEVLEAWAAPGVLDRTLHFSFGDMPAQFALGIHFVDNLVHRWDLATATGQDTGLDSESAALALEMCQTNMKDRPRGTAFADEVPWPADAPVHERLVAFLGRRP